VIMLRNRSLTDLKNIGIIIASRLNEIGVISKDELRHVGATGAHQMIKEKLPEETLPVCYCLHSFEGSLIDAHWNEIGEQKNKQLNSQIG